MPGRFFLTTPVARVAQAFGVPDPSAADGARRNIQPGQEVWVLTLDGLQRMRWGIIPVGRVNARGRPVMETIINARSETVFDKSAFEGVRRVVIPVDGWYEWTGKTRRKTAWRLSARDGGLLLFAGIADVWTAPGGRVLHQVAAVTCEPNADVRDIHHRMGVILAQKDVGLWLGASEEAARDLMRPLPDGVLQIEPAEDVDWSGA
ncbi:SOS response-associated peptidase [Ruegeria sp. 2205SS24-7]|uniref:SOS response-associated peptidase n=1 Tax=Ruegeria discodermiae TaxID=3064389 RepID=UPI0027405D3E|nr:SOS response-associated peptidase [Ruegeria sp. 2205SS24-7]MDP5217609.1 SOS response-associated peptidase [Ruegeria sp. 2205SS24-7]